MLRAAATWFTCAAPSTRPMAASTAGTRYGSVQVGRSHMHARVEVSATVGTGHLPAASTAGTRYVSVQAGRSHAHARAEARALVALAIAAPCCFSRCQRRQRNALQGRQDCLLALLSLFKRGPLTRG